VLLGPVGGVVLPFSYGDEVGLGWSAFFESPRQGSVLCRLFSLWNLLQFPVTRIFFATEFAKTFGLVLAFVFPHFMLGPVSNF